MISGIIIGTIILGLIFYVFYEGYTRIRNAGVFLSVLPVVIVLFIGGLFIIPIAYNFSQASLYQRETEENIKEINSKLRYTYQSITNSITSRKAVTVEKIGTFSEGGFLRTAYVFKNTIPGIHLPYYSYTRKEILPNFYSVTVKFNNDYDNNDDYLPTNFYFDLKKLSKYYLVKEIDIRRTVTKFKVYYTFIQLEWGQNNKVQDIFVDVYDNNGNKLNQEPLKLSDALKEYSNSKTELIIVKYVEQGGKR